MATTLRNSSRSSNSSTAIGRSFLMCVCALMGIGLVLVYSASFVLASETYNDGLYIFKRQLVFVGISLLGLGLASRVSYKILEKYFWIFFVPVFIALVSVFIPGLGHRVGGALRWINLGHGFKFEPSEFYKLISPLIFSYLLVYDKQSDEPWWKFWSIVFSVLVFPVFILLKQPDFGSSVIVFLVGFTVLFCFGLPWRYIFSLVIVSIPLFYFLVMNVEYRRNRILAFLNPWDDPGRGGFQVIQSLLGLHAGGISGVGIGKGQAKLFFLPEAHTDFILAVLGEETGFIGIALVLFLFGWLVLRGIQIAVRCPDPFGKRLAIGLSSFIFYEAVINTGVVTGLLPTKGLTMPFLSYGGTSLLSVSIACGILLNIHRRTVA